MQANYDYTEIYEATIKHTVAALRKIKFPVAKLEAPVVESLMCVYGQYQSYYVGTYYLHLNRKDTEVLLLEFSSTVNGYHISKPNVTLYFIACGIPLDTTQRLDGFITLMKRAGRTIEDMYDYLNGIDPSRNPRNHPRITLR